MIDDKNLNEIDLTEEDNRTLPEWEQALSEYAHETAPDLLPGILAKINAAPPKQDDTVRLKKYRRLMLLRRASAAAAVVLVVGILLYAITKIPKTQEDTSMPADRTTPAFTTSITPAKLKDDTHVSDTPANATDPKSVGDKTEDRPSVTDELQGDPTSEPVASNDSPRLGDTYQLIILAPGKYGGDAKSPLPDGVVSDYTQYREAESFATYSLSDEGDTLENVIAVRAGNAVSEPSTSRFTYRLFAEGCNLSDVLLLSDEEFVYRRFETLTVVPAGIGEGNDTTYRLFESADTEP